MRMKWIVSRALTALLVASVTVPALAGATEEATGRRGDRARAYLVLRISESLNLSDEKALEVSSILRRSGDARRTLRQERKGLAAPLRAAVDKGDESDVQQLVARANEIDRKLSLMPSESFLQVQAILSPIERGKLLLLLPELQKELRNRRRGRRGAGGPRVEPPAAQ